MDEFPEPPPAAAARLRFAPDMRLTVGYAVLTVLAIAAAIRADDPTGALLFGLAALVLGCYTASDLLWRPRLVLDTDGLTVRTPWLGLAGTRVGWSDLDAARVDVQVRHGLRTTALELEAGDRLLVLTRRSLGADPAAVADLIAAFAPPRP